MKPPDSSAPPMVLLSAFVLALVMVAWYTRAYYLADLSDLVNWVAEHWLGYDR